MSGAGPTGRTAGREGRPGPASRLPFWKMNGSGNDFILVDNRRRRIPPEAGPDLARRVCVRNFSVGADGLILIEASAAAHFAWRFYNADGSEAAMCGNGGRCAARFAFLKGIAPEKMSFQTGAGLIHAEVRGERVKLQLPLPTGRREGVRVPLEGIELEGGFIVVGVPHAVFLVSRAEEARVESWGRTVRFHALFAPAGTNVNFAEVAGPRRLRVRTYERGVEGETMACGTGAVASALLAALAGRVKGPVEVETRGGELLRVYFRRRGERFSEVFLEGGAQVSFEGRLWDGP